MRILIRKDIRMDLDGQYRWSAYNKAIEEARHYMKIDGVKECVDNIQHDADSYEEKLKQFLESQRAEEAEKYNHFEPAAHKYNICVWIGVGIIIVRLFLFFAVISGHLEGLYIAGHVITWLYILVFIILLIMAKMMERQYRLYVKNTLGKITQINNEFLNRVSTFENTVDNIYLNSLEPFQCRQELDMRKREEERKKDEQWKKETLNEQKRIRESQERSEIHLRNAGQVLSEWNEERHKRY